MKNSNDTIGNRTRDVPTCSAVPQPTAPPRTPVKIGIVVRIPAEAIYFSFLLIVKAGCGAHLVSSVIEIRVSFPGVKLPWREADHSFPSSTKIVNEWSITSCSPYAFIACPVTLLLATCAYGQHCYSVSASPVSDIVMH